MMYEGRCPHCGNIVRGGHGTPMKRISTPVRTCYRCGKKYMDENMYEWGVLDPVYKLWFYFGANNRGIVLGISLFLGIASLSVNNVSGGAGLLAFSAIWMIVCYVYVKIAHKDAMEESKKRCASTEYIELLNQIKYDKLARKFDNYYKD